MAQEHYQQLGLSAGKYTPRELDQQFQCRRQDLLRRLEQQPSVALQTELDDLYIAYQALRHRRPARGVPVSATGDQPVDQLRRLIGASLEDGLLRQSRREAILEKAGALGFNEFQAHLLIAQVQFGDEEITPVPRQTPAGRPAAASRAWARLAAVGVMAVATFWMLATWAGI